jgi:hypothetical protein
MTNYYITEDNTEQGRIIERATFIAPHWGDRYFSTEENLVIVSNGESGDTIVKQS